MTEIERWEERWQERMGRGEGKNDEEKTRELKPYSCKVWEWKRETWREREREAGGGQHEKWHEKWPFFASVSHLFLPWQWTIKLASMRYCIGIQFHRLLILIHLFSLWLSKISIHFMAKEIGFLCKQVPKRCKALVRMWYTAPGQMSHLSVSAGHSLFDYIFSMELINTWNPESTPAGHFPLWLWQQ